MTIMATLKAVVQGGRVIIEEPVGYPDGTELELEVVESAHGELDEAELAELDESLERSWEDIKAGRIRPGSEILKEL
jgi:hypothetical protein